MSESPRYIKFKEIATFRNGLNFNKKSYGRGCLFVGVTDFKNNFKPNYDYLDEVIPDGIVKDEDYLKKNDLLFVRSNGNKALVGRCLFIDRNIKLLFSGFCIRARLTNETFDPLFLAYFTKTHFFKSAITQVKGTNINNLNQEVLGDVKIPLFTKQYQIAIINVLNSVFDKIELNNKINAELEAMAKTLYDYWFVQFDFPWDPSSASGSGRMSEEILQGKPYKSSGGKMVYNEELKREIPEGWGADKIGNILAKEGATKKILSSEILRIGLIPVIDQSTDFISGFTNDQEALIKADVPRIVFGDHTRIMKLINFDFARGADGTQILLSTSPQMPQHLFYQTLLKIDLSNYGYARHFKFLKEAKIIIPSEYIAQKFDTLVKNNYEMIRENNIQNQTLTQLRDWLLPMLMNGQVKVAGR